MSAILPGIALAMFLLGLAGVTAHRRVIQPGYLVPAALAVVFAGWTLHTISVGGLTGFWAEHVRNAWSNQIWFDLLLAFGMTWFLMLPRLRAAGMWIPGWLALFLCTGSFGLLVALARCFYLEVNPPKGGTA